MLADSELLDNGIHARWNSGGWNRGERGEPRQRIFRLPVRVDRHELRQIADAVFLDECARIHSANEYRAASGLQIAQEERKQSALSRPVGTRNPEYFAFGDIEREINDRRNRAAEQGTIGF